MRLKHWIAGMLGLLGVGILALLAVTGYTALGRSRGEEWGSLTGPEPVWPAIIGFGALNLIPLSAVVLVILVVCAIARAGRPGRPDRPDRPPGPPEG